MIATTLELAHRILRWPICPLCHDRQPRGRLSVHWLIDHGDEK